MNSQSKSQTFDISAYDLFILMVTVLSMTSLIVIMLPFFDLQAKQIALSLDTFLSVIFLLDFFYILIKSPNKGAYLKWGWIDFLGSLPYLPLLRFLRIFRAIRSLRFLNRGELKTIWQEIRFRPESATFLAITFFAIVLVSLSSYTILQVEQFSPEKQIESPGDALWWAIVTITTVGYGDRVPTTPIGRLVATLLMFVGIGIFGVLTSYLSSAFIKSKSEGEDAEGEINARLAAIEQHLAELSASIQKLNKTEK